MNACSVRSKELGVALDLNERDAGLLKEGRRAYKELEALVKGWKAKAVEESPKAPSKQLAPSMQASEAEAHGTDGEAADMGEPVRPYFLLSSLFDLAIARWWADVCA